MTKLQLHRRRSRSKRQRLSVDLHFAWEVELDARELVGRMLGVIETRCKAALREGVRPDTGRARPARGSTTWGISSGRLLDNIRSTPALGGPELAHGRVSVPPDRQVFAAKQDVLTAEGKVDEAVQDAIDGYLGERLE